jgi:hypothetical protein
MLRYRQSPMGALRSRVMLDLLLCGLIGYLGLCYAWGIYVAARLYVIGKRRTRPLQVLDLTDETDLDAAVHEPGQEQIQVRTSQKSKAAA